MTAAFTRSPAVVARLAPTGALRAVINLGNAVLARVDATSGEAQGVSVDLAQALADALGVPLALTTVETAARAVDAVATEAVDVGFFAIDPGRAADIAFSDAYVLIEGAYLVRDESPLRDVAEVDSPGRRVVVGRGSAYDLHLTRAIKLASLLRATSSQAVVDTFLAEGADVAAGVRQQLQADARRLPGLRLLPGRFMVIRQAMACSKSRGDEAAATLAAFVEHAKSTGRVADALARHGVNGASVAPPASA